MEEKISVHTTTTKKKIHIKILKRKRDMFLKLIPNDLFCLIRFIYYT